MFVAGAIIGGTWDDNDTAGAITVALWVVSIAGAILLLAAFTFARARGRQRV